MGQTFFLNIPFVFVPPEVTPNLVIQDCDYFHLAAKCSSSVLQYIWGGEERSIFVYALGMHHTS